MNDEQVKRCPKCQETKSLSEFYIRKSGKRVGQARAYCKVCKKLYDKTYNASNLEPPQSRQTRQVRLCPQCHETKPLSEFYILKTGRKAGLTTGYCKDCSRFYGQAYYAANPEKVRLGQKKWIDANPEKMWLSHLKVKYGLSQEEYEKMLKECAICGSTERLQIDHNHVTGKVRDILCGPCNRGLGQFRDDSNLLIRATDYILKHFSQEPP